MSISIPQTGSAAVEFQFGVRVWVGGRITSALPIATRRSGRPLRRPCCQHAKPGIPGHLNPAEALVQEDEKSVDLHRRRKASLSDPNSEDVRREYARLASDYDRRWTFYIDTTVKATIDRLHLSGCKRLLDVSCGTGVLLERLGQRDGSISLFGLDISRPMLQVAVERRRGFLAVVHGGAEFLQFETGGFDQVVCS